MGVFDYVRIKYAGHGIGDVSGEEFQSKDTPTQYMDQYEIREDGTMWHEAHDTEDRSDPTQPGLLGMFGVLTPVNHRWEQVDYEGELEVDQYLFWFRNGVVADVIIEPDEDPTQPIANNHKTD